MVFKRCKCPEPTRCTHPFWYVFELNGRRYRRSTRTANRQTAGRIEGRRRNAILDGKDDTPIKAITLATHIDEYCAHTEEHNVTAYKDEAVLDRFLLVAGKATLVKDVSPFHVEKWKQQRAAAVKKSTVNRELNIVRGCFTKAVEWKRLAVSPCTTVQPFKVDDQRIRVLDDVDLKRILSCEQPDVALMCRTTLECLPRLSEVLNIQRAHIGPDWIEFRRKGGHVTRAAVPIELRNALLARCHTSGYVFGEGDKGNPPTEQAASNRIVRALESLGITGASHHTMRHTGVTLMLEHGVNPRAIQMLAGWTNLRMLERYGHARDTEVRRAVNENAAHLERIAR